MPAQMCQLVSLTVTVFNFVIAIFPLIGLGVLMYGSVLWATSAQDPQKLETAKKTLTSGVLGFVLGLSVVAILLTVENLFLDKANFTISDLTSLKVNFCVSVYFDACGTPGGQTDPCVNLNKGDPTKYGTGCEYTLDDNGEYDGGFVCCPGSACGGNHTPTPPP